MKFQILSQKLEWKASPKVGSLANVTHKPTGGDVKVCNFSHHTVFQKKKIFLFLDF